MAWACQSASTGQAAHILTELNKQLAIAPALVGRQRQDAGHIVVFCGLLFLEEAQVSVREGLGLSVG